jgi:hypothetical protein
MQMRKKYAGNSNFPTPKQLTLVVVVAFLLLLSVFPEEIAGWAGQWLRRLIESFTRNFSG